MMESQDLEKILDKASNKDALLSWSDPRLARLEDLKKLNHGNLAQMTSFFIYDSGPNRHKLYVVMNASSGARSNLQ